MGGGGGGTGDGEGSRGPRSPPLSEGLLDRGLYVCVRGAGWAIVVFDDMLNSSVKDRMEETVVGEVMRPVSQKGGDIQVGKRQLVE